MRVSKKILIAVLSLILLFAVSCDNENKTGGGGGISPTSPEADSGISPSSPVDSGETVTESKGETSKPKDEKIIRVYKKEGETETKQDAAIILFPDPDPELGKINKVKPSSASPIDGAPNGFSGNSFEYNKDNGELKLSTDGLGYVGQSTFPKGEHKYTVKFDINENWEIDKKKSVEITIIKDY